MLSEIRNDKFTIHSHLKISSNGWFFFALKHYFLYVLTSQVLILLFVISSLLGNKASYCDIWLTIVIANKKYIPNNFDFILIRSAIVRGVEQVENCSQRDIKSGDNLILQGMICWPGNFRYDFIIQTWVSPETCFRTIQDDFHCQQLTLIKLFFLQASVLGN